MVGAQMNARAPIPLRPDPSAIAERGRRSLSRALLASARCQFETDKNPHRIIEREYLHDDGAALILKAPTAPISTANSALSLQTVEAAVLGGTGAGADLLRRGLMLSFGRNASISLPALIADAEHASFVAEGAPIPVRSLDIDTPVVMAPHKLASIWAMTREVVDGSNAEALVTERRQALDRSRAR